MKLLEHFDPCDLLSFEKKNSDYHFNQGTECQQCLGSESGSGTF